MDDIEVTIKSFLPPDEPQGVYHLRIGRQDTVEKLLRRLCQETKSPYRDEFCLRSKERQLLKRSDRIYDIGLKDGASLHWTTETTNVEGACFFNTFWFLALISFIIGVVGIISLCIIKYKKTDPIIDYAIVFDAGSSHTSMFIYKWDGSKLNDTAVVVQNGNKCTAKGGGISSYVDHPPDAGKSLQECLTTAKKAIPKSKHASTPVYLGATAGMRLLNISNPDESQEIMQSVRATFKNTPFNFSNPEGMVRIISGFDEGSFSWITSNYITNAFGVLDHRHSKDDSIPASTVIPSMGALDLGGASTQISFIPSNTSNIPSGYSRSLTLFGHNYELYTHSYLCYGVNELKKRVLAKLVIGHGVNSTEMVHECLPEGFSTTISYKDIFNSPCVHGDTADEAFGFSIHPPAGVDFDRNYTFTGNNFPDECRDLVRSVAINSSLQCPYDSCSFNGVYQPPVNGLFYAFSAYYYTVSFLNLTTPEQRYFNISDFLSATSQICIMPWEIMKTLPYSKKLLPWYCQEAMFIDVLLSEGYHFKDKQWPNINFVNKVSLIEVGWTLGFVMNESNGYPSDTPEVTLYTVTFVLLLILFCLFLLVAVVLGFQGYRTKRRSSFRSRKMSTYGAI